MIDLRNHYGFTRLPFGKDLAPSMLHQHAGCAEAAARISWCISERALGVITGEVGAGKTVAARAAIAALDQTRHTLIYLANPTTGTRGLHYQIVIALGGRPSPRHRRADRPGRQACSPPSTANAAAPPSSSSTKLTCSSHDQLEAVRMLTNDQMDAASPLACLLIGQPTLRRMLRLGVLAALDQRIALRYAIPAMTPAETASYISPPPQTRRPLRPAVQRRRHHPHPRSSTRAAPGHQQHRPAGTRRRLGRTQSHRRRDQRPHRRHRGHVRLTITRASMNTKAPPAPPGGAFQRLPSSPAMTPASSS